MNDKVSNEQMAEAQKLATKSADTVAAKPEKPAVVQTAEDVNAEALV